MLEMDGAPYVTTDGVPLKQLLPAAILDTLLQVEGKGEGREGGRWGRGGGRGGGGGVVTGNATALYYSNGWYRYIYCGHVSFVHSHCHGLLSRVKK